MSTRLRGTVASATAGLLVTGLGLASPPAQARPDGEQPAQAVLRPAFHGPTLTASRLASVRAQQQAMLARPTPALTLAAAAARASAKVATLTVTTTEDSELADPSGTRCVDAATAACSLRAAVEAANNRATPVRIVLGRHTYRLSTGADLQVSNPAGTSFVGAGTHRTAIAGDGSRVLEVLPGTTGASALVFLDRLTVTGGTAENFGGGILVGSGTATGAVVLDHVAVTGNTAVSSGGGIYAVQAANLYLSHSTISDNTAPDGGGLYTGWSDVNLVNVDITGNHVVGTGGGGGAGWYDEFGVGTMTGGSISGNGSDTPPPASAGGGLLDSFGNLTFTDVSFDHNSLGSGAGIYAHFDLIEIDGGTISHNVAVDDADVATGGGLAMDGGAQVGLHGVTMIGNRVPVTSTEGVGGGAVFDFGSGSGNQLTIDKGSRITGSNGSAVYAFAEEGQVDLEIDHARLAHNTDSSGNALTGSGCGGAVCAFSAASGSLNVTLNAATLTGNTSAGNGGAGGLSIYVANSSGARVHLLHSTFDGNATGAGGHGGAVGIFSNNNNARVSLRSSANTFTANQAGTPSASGRGGALAIEGGAAFEDAGSTFTRNRSWGPESFGGAVYGASRQSSAFDHTRFTRNSASPRGIGHGGAVYTDDDLGTTYAHVSVSRNRSGQFGGGLDSGPEGADVRVVGSTIAGNVAGSTARSGAGGGIHTTAAVLRITNSTVTGNRALQSATPSDVASGGGISTAGSTLGLSYSTVTGNVASRGGGYFAGAAGGAVLGSIVSANHAPSGREQDCAVSAPTAVPHSLGGNVLGQAACVTAVQANDVATRHPRLKRLAANGGPTRTMALRKKSPAVARSTFLCPAIDQRGRHRPATHCDAGAYELPKIVKRHHH